jgi:hypothetical protein
MAGYFDFINPRAQRRRSAFEAAKLLLERQGVSALPDAPGVSQQGNTAMFRGPEGIGTLPAPQLGPADDLDLYKNLFNSSDQPRHVVGALTDFLKERAIQRESAQLDTPAERVMALGGRDVDPVGMSGGVAYNRFSGETNPILGESSAVQALATERLAGAEENEADAQAARATAGLRGVQARQAGAAAPRPRITGLRPDGKLGYFDSFIGPNGAVQYRPVLGPDGSPLEAKPDAASGPSAFERNTQYEAGVRGISEKEVLEQSRKSNVTPALVRDVEQELMEANRPKYRNDPAALKKDVDERIGYYVNIANRGGTPEQEAPATDDVTADAEQINASEEQARLAALRKSARKVKTVDEARALPEGTYFLDPAGNLRVR